MNRNDLIGRTIGHLTFYSVIGGNVHVKQDSVDQQLTLVPEDKHWHVQLDGVTVNTSTLEDCVAWCRDFCRESFMEDYPRRDLKHKPLVRHDYFETDLYTVLVDQTEYKWWDFTVKLRSTGEKLLTRSFYKSYEAAVEGFAGWLWDSDNKVITQSDVEHYCDWLTEQCHNTMQEALPDWFLLNSLDNKEDYHAYLWADGIICGWRYRTNRGHYSYVSPRLYVAYTGVVQRIACDIFSRGVETQYSFTPFFNWLEEQNEQQVV